MNYILHVGVMLTIVRVFIILFLLVRIGNIPSQKKSVSFQLSVQVYSLLGQTQGERKAFFEGCKKGDHKVRLPQRALGCLSFLSNLK